MTRLLVLGGTRFVGRAVVEEALAYGWHVTAVHRGVTGALPDVATALQARCHSPRWYHRPRAAASPPPSQREGGRMAAQTVPARGRAPQAGRRSLQALGWAGGAVVVAFAVLPLWYVVVLSLTPDPAGAGAGLWPRTLSLVNYRALALPGYHFYPAMGRSILLSACTTAVSLLVAVPGAYALSRMRVPGAGRVLASMLALAFFPGILLVVPVRARFAELGWLDHLPTIGLAQLSFTVPLAVWFLAHAFRQVPDEVEEAAHLDGAGTLQRIVRIVLPMSRPGVAATTALVFVSSWNDFLFSAALSQTPRGETLPVTVSKLPTIGFLGGQMAAGVLMCAPVALLVAGLVRWFQDRDTTTR